MRPYLCVCADPCCAEAADKIRDSAARYGFRVLSVPGDCRGDERAALLTGCRCAVAVTSPEAENGCVGADIRLLLSAGIPVMCLSLGDNTIDRRLCVPSDPDGEPPRHAAELVPFPLMSEPDAGQSAWIVHRFLIRRLCRCTDCFSPDDCADDEAGRAVSLAVAAWAGDCNAAYALAGLYESGEGLPSLQSEVMRWTEAAAAGHHPDAMLRLAAYRLDGVDGIRDPGAALSLYRQVDDERGLFGLGLCAEFGFGMLSDPDEAVKLYRLAIERAGGAYPEAWLRLGLVMARKARAGQPGAFAAAADALRRAALSDADADIDMPLILRRPAGRHDNAGTGTRSVYRSVYRLVSLRSMAEKTLIPLLISRGVSPADSRVVMRRCRWHRRTYQEDAWLPIPVSWDADTADVDLYGHFSEMRFDASMPAYALGLLLEEAHRLLPSGTAEDRALRAGGADALRWYRFAGGRGHSAAMHRLADCYRQGFGVPRDPRQAVRLYEKAAELGDHDSRFLLGICLEQGIGTEQDAQGAVRLYEKAAGAGHAPAMNNLGGCYERGFGVERDQLTAVDWYTRAAKLGQPEAVYRLGRCAESGMGVRRDPDRAAELYLEAAAAGNPYAVYRLGLFADHELSEKVRPTNGTRLYEEAALAGVPEAAYAMGLCARSGRGTRREPGDAFRWFSLGADKSAQHIQCTFEKACCLFDGEGTVRDRRAAVALFGETVRLWEARRALPPPDAAYEADGGLVPSDGLTADEAAAEAMFRLGFCTLYGIGTGQADTAAGVAWLTRAAEAGHAGACTLTGDLYAWGLLHADTLPASAPAGASGSEAVSSADRLLCAPSELYPNPWKRTSAVDRAEAVKWYRRAIDCSRLSGQTCREGRADALMSLSLEASVWADRLYAAGKPSIARAADAVCFGYLEQAADMDESRDEALLLLAASVYGGRNGTEAAPGASGSQQAAAYLKDIRRRSPAFAAAETAAGDFILYALETGPGMTLNASPYVQTAAHYLRALNKFHIVGADSNLTERILAGTEQTGQTGTPREEAGRRFCLPERAACRQAMAEQVRREVMYRMAILCASHLRTERIPEPTSDRAVLGHKVCFAYLAQAILLGHPQAKDDLARMLAHPAASAEQPITRRLRLPGAAVGRHAAGAVPVADPSPLMKEYYAADRRMTVPFTPGIVLRPDAVSGEPVDPSAEPVTPAMAAAAMNFLGDCLYYGQYLPVDKEAAVKCFREAADTRAPDCAAVTWAQYSLGCCLVNGVGTEADPREGVRYLTDAAKSHGAAAYTLASCYENGTGVDPGDYRYREAVKFYRRALALGYRPAEDRLKAMGK